MLAELSYRTARRCDASRDCCGPCISIFCNHHQHHPTAIGTTDDPATMPRSLARLRWKDPPKPFIFPKLSPTNGFLFAKKAEKYVARHSNPPHGKVHTVVNERARRQPAGRSAMTPRRPYTLRDLVDPKGTKEHGEIIYVFRHTITNQIIYSLQELLDVCEQT